MTKRIFALGFFDGVHRGHQVLLGECRALAERYGAKSAAITFDRHPAALFAPETPELLNSLDDRAALLRDYGMEEIFPLPVTPEMMGMEWRSFLELLEQRGAVGFVCGHDFRFGHRGAGNAALLAEYCREKDIPCVIVPEQTMEGKRISSTRIREHLERGEMETARKLLGHPHMLTGTVVPGRKLGHRLGFPTANVLLPQGVICPAHGVYACRAVVDGVRYPAVTNIGSRPTVDGHQVRSESWILGFAGDLYGKAITLEFYRFLRREEKFPDVQTLVEQVKKDGANALEYFANLENKEK